MWVGRVCARALQDKTQTWRRKKENQAPQGAKGGSVIMVDTQDDEDDPEYVFAVGDKKQEKIEVIIGVCKLGVIIDSGTSTNMIDKQTWEWLKRKQSEV